MVSRLRVAIGQCSEAGVKSCNQDFHAAVHPDEPQLTAKGVTVALADGISSSAVGQIAAQAAVQGFLADYYATSEAWSVKNSGERVLRAINSWLYAQSRNGPYPYDRNRGYVCTFSAVIIKSTTAHLFHVGDSRICYMIDNRLEALTEDHRLWVSAEQSYLSRALGMRDGLELSYRAYTVEQGDILVLMTDGVYEFIDGMQIARLIRQYSDDLDHAARRIVATALERGSDDNLTIQIVRVDELPLPEPAAFYPRVAALPLPPELGPRRVLDGYEIVREIHRGHRSHVYLAIDQHSGEEVVLKTPSITLRNDSGYLECFLMEEWVARRVDSPHVIKAPSLNRHRSCLYIVLEYIDGQTLEQWLHDHPEPDLEKVRGIVEQIAKGLRALHRQEMLHQDLRPANVMIDRHGTVKLIDLGTVRVAGVAETGVVDFAVVPGTQQYAAPEYFIGESGTTRSDLFSLGVIAYQMLSGRLPYGPEVAKATTRMAQYKLTYQSVLEAHRAVPLWVDGALRKAVHPNPARRYETLSEFLYDLRHPNPAFVNAGRAPLLERHPVRFWKGCTLILILIIGVLLVTHPAVQPFLAR